MSIKKFIDCFLECYNKDNGGQQGKEVKFPLKAPDVSRYRVVDFNVWKGNDLFFKATDGRSYVDPKFQHHLNNCLQKDIRFGVYHFWNCSHNWQEQADHFIETVGTHLRDSFYLPVLDFEPSKSKGQGHKDLLADRKNIELYMEKVNNYTKRKTMIYSASWYIRNLWKDYDTTRLLELTSPPWQADWKNVPTGHGPWDSMAIHQYTDKEKVKGIDNVKGCDMNTVFKVS